MTRGASPRALLGAAVLAYALAVSDSPLAAQEAAPTPSPSPATPAPTAGDQSAEAKQQQTMVEEITVTAQKRKEDIQDVPVSVSVYDAEQLQTLTTGGGDVLSLSGRVPSLTLESSFGRAFPRFYIRGLGNTDFDLNASQPVSMLVDDVVLENPVTKGMPLWDIDHVEVLRGPQGTLFGRNTPAGVVKFDTRKPTDTFDGYTQVSYGTYNNVDAQAAVGGRLSDTLSGRVSALYQTQDNWVANKFTGNQHALGGYDEKAARAQLEWKPSADFDALLNLHGWELNGTARIFRANIIEKRTNDLVPGFRQDTVYQDGLNDQWIHSHGGALKMNWELGPATLTSVTGYETLDMYSRGDIDGGYGCGLCGLPNGPGFIPFSSESADGVPNLDQWTEELRLASHSGGKWDYLLGFFWFDEKLKVDSFSYDSLNHNVQNGFAFQNQKDKSWALFGSLDFRPTDRWTLKGGLRYTSDKKDFSAERPQPTFQTPTVAPITVNTDAGLLTGDFSAAYKVSETLNVYGRVGTGFRAPSIQGRILFCPDFEGGTNPATNCVDVAHEEKIVSAEIGVKTELLDRKLRLNLDTYDYQMKGQQIVAVGGRYNTATLLNADRTNGYGVEADLEALPSSKWLITLGTSYNHTAIDDPNLFVQPCGGGCSVLDPITPGGLASVNGNPLPHAPKWIIDGAVDFRQPIGSSLLDARLDWAYSSTKNFFLYESKEFRSDSFEVGARIGWLFAETKYELALFGHNLANRVIVQNGIDFDNLTGMTNEPRQIGIQFIAHF